MNTFRSIPAFLYLITMVLLPYGHMPLHGTDEAQRSEHHGCTHAHHDPDSESQPDSGTGDDCSLCNLTLLPTEIQSIHASARCAFALCTQAETITLFFSASTAFEQRARAPPFVTV